MDALLVFVMLHFKSMDEMQHHEPPTPLISGRNPPALQADCTAQNSAFGVALWGIYRQPQRPRRSQQCDRERSTQSERVCARARERQRERGGTERERERERDRQGGASMSCVETTQCQVSRALPEQYVSFQSTCTADFETKVPS